jgi:Tfp pilus assembly protein PilX
VKVHQSRRSQRGATLVMGIIFLTLLMLSVAVAFRMSNNNLKAVGNMQSQAEAEAAAEAAIEILMSTETSFTAPVATNVPADAYGVAVSVAAPQCVRSVPVDASTSADTTPNIYLQNVTPTSASGYVETHWDVAATASSGVTGAKAEIHQGVKIILPADPNPCP